MDLIKLTKQVEQISAIYANKFAVERDGNWFMLKLSEELGELTQAYLKVQKQARIGEVAEAELMIRFEDEMADVLGQLLLLANHFEVDLETAVQRKWLRWLPKES
ncbi:MAG: pyrophosphatase [Chloroflexota bacterium]